MKIAILVNSAPPFPVSGAERQALEMARRLTGHHQVVVFARRFGGAPIVEPVDGYTLIRVPFTDWGPLRFPSHVWNFDRLFARHAAGADVILSYQTFITGWLGARARDRHGVPLVVWIRSQEEYQYTKQKKFGWAGRYVLPRTDRLLVQSLRLGDELLNEARAAYGPAMADRLAGRMSVGVNAVTMTADAPSAGRDILFVGRLVEFKDLSTLLRALRRMAHPPPTRIVGDGPMRAAWESEAAGLPVTFAGRVEPAAIAAEYARGRLLVLLSRGKEGLPNVILEAMAAGVPVLSTPVSAAPDVVTDGQNGFLFPFGDDGALAAHLARLWSDDALRDRLARGAIETARAHSWDKVTTEVEEVLAGVVVAGTGPAGRS